MDNNQYLSLKNVWNGYLIYAILLGSLHSTLLQKMKEGNGHIVTLPGQRICEATSSHVAGEGTYIFNKYIYASQAGRVIVEPRGGLQVVKVRRK